MKPLTVMLISAAMVLIVSGGAFFSAQTVSKSGGSDPASTPSACSSGDFVNRVNESRTGVIGVRCGTQTGDPASSCPVNQLAQNEKSTGALQCAPSPAGFDYVLYTASNGTYFLQPTFSNPNGYSSFHGSDACLLLNQSATTFPVKAVFVQRGTYNCNGNLDVGVADTLTQISGPTGSIIDSLPLFNFASGSVIMCSSSLAHITVLGNVTDPFGCGFNYLEDVVVTNYLVINGVADVIIASSANIILQANSVGNYLLINYDPFAVATIIDNSGGINYIQTGQTGQATCPALSGGTLTNTLGDKIEVLWDIGATATTVQKNGVAISGGFVSQDISVVLNAGETTHVSQTVGVTKTCWYI